MEPKETRDAVVPQLVAEWRDPRAKEAVVRYRLVLIGTGFVLERAEHDALGGTRWCRVFATDGGLAGGRGLDAYALILASGMTEVAGRADVATIHAILDDYQGAAEGALRRALEVAFPRVRLG
jgi:hypothetical protein